MRRHCEQCANTTVSDGSTDSMLRTRGTARTTAPSQRHTPEGSSSTASSARRGLHAVAAVTARPTYTPAPPAHTRVRIRSRSSTRTTHARTLAHAHARRSCAHMRHYGLRCAAVALDILEEYCNCADLREGRRRAEVFVDVRRTLRRSRRPKVAPPASPAPWRTVIDLTRQVYCARAGLR